MTHLLCISFLMALQPFSESWAIYWQSLYCKEYHFMGQHVHCHRHIPIFSSTSQVGFGMDHLQKKNVEVLYEEKNAISEWLLNHGRKEWWTFLSLVFQNHPDTLWGLVFGTRKGLLRRCFFWGPNTLLIRYLEGFSATFLNEAFEHRWMFLFLKGP